MSMVSSGVSDAILFSKDKSLNRVLKDVCRMRGISNVIVCDDKKETQDAIKRFQQAIIVIHIAEEHLAETVAILTTCSGPTRIEARPVLAITESVSPPLLSTIIEYNVTQLHAGAYDTKILNNKLGVVIRSIAPSRAIKLLFERIQKLREQGQWAQARNLLQDASQKAPNNLRLQAELAENLLQEHLLVECLETLKPLLTVKPPYLRALQIKARVLMLQDKLNEAQSVLEQAELFNPHNVERLVDLGEILLKAGELEAAGERFDRALATDEDSLDAKKGKGKTLLMTEQVNEALEFMRNSVSKQELASMFNMSAIMSMKQKKAKVGMRLYDSAIKALGSDSRLKARLMYNKGLGYQRLNRPKLAANCLKEATELDPSFDKAKSSLERLKVVAAKAPAKPKSAALSEPPAGTHAQPAPADFADEQLTPGKPPFALPDDAPTAASPSAVSTEDQGHDSVPDVAPMDEFSADQALGALAETSQASPVQQQVEAGDEDFDLPDPSEFDDFEEDSMEDDEEEAS